MISPKVEDSRIRYALRGCKDQNYQVFEPTSLVKKAVDEHGDSLAVSCSFGSCSVVVLHMALQFKPDIKVVFNNTGVQYKETYDYRDLLVNEWDLNLIETKPLKPFWDCVKEFGFPLIRTSYSYKKRKGLKSRYHKPECCIFTKELPMRDACKEHQITASLTGLRASESGVRMFTISQRGMFYHTKKFGDLWRYHPIALWNTEQVNQYLKDNDIPMNEVYTKLGLPRSGCMPCTGFLYWEKQLSRINPKMYRYIQKLRGVPLLDDFMTIENEVYNQTCGSPQQQVLEEWF